ncbi:MAG: SGNH/GDSL hydrolase family protein [Oculatellaceae cyanobacterium Prado106]|jgi:phospholipase/lecithinase/hemolysin|nr:SGNH/GDSL hydrolase family protein [Oculatellaceae cyanobacterium Prado106]
MVKPLPATEPPRFSCLYVFGDSFADTGNAFQLTQGILANHPNRQHRFANDLIWIDYLADFLWLTFQCSSLPMRRGDGVNYAVGGATTGTVNLFPALMPVLPELPGLQQQIQAFAASFKRKKRADADALYILSVGMTDYIPLVNGTPYQADPKQSIHHLSDAIATLIKVGAKHILLSNLPDLGKTPIADAAHSKTPISTVATAIATHNQALVDLVQSFQPKANVMLLDVKSLIDDAIAHPAQLGLRNVTLPCSQIEGCNPNDYLFWDQMHFTSQVHQQIAKSALVSICEAAIPSLAPVMGG